MKITVTKGKESMDSVIESKVDQSLVKARKVMRDAEREIQETNDKVKNKIDEVSLRIKQAKKKII
jgi:ElaB/YqjD/DUF883 family membrane-anchored ribosome-binding protein